MKALDKKNPKHSTNLAAALEINFSDFEDLGENNHLKADEITELQILNIKEHRKPRTLYQSNIITMSRYEMSALEKNIMYMVMAQVRSGDHAEHVYRVDASELKRILNRELNIEGLKEATHKLLTRVVEGEDESGNYFQTTFISSATYILGKGIIEITLAPKIRPYYVELTQCYTVFQLETAMNLTGKYTKRIYEMLSMHKNFMNPELKIKVVKLKQILGILDKKGNDTYPTYALFRRLVLDKAIEEMKQYPGIDISVQYEEVLGKNLGRGRKPVESLIFQIHKLVDREEESEELKILTKEFSLRRDQAVSIINQYTRQEIRKKIYDIRLQVNNNSIKNIGGYVAKIFNVQ